MLIGKYAPIVFQSQTIDSLLYEEPSDYFFGYMANDD